MDQQEVSPKVVVVVDDDITITTLLENWLQSEGFLVVVFNDAKAALDYIREHHAEIWRVSLDQLLDNPFLNGDSIADECSKLNLPFYRFVGYGQEELRIGEGRFIKPMARDLAKAMVDARDAERVPLAANL